MNVEQLINNFARLQQELCNARRLGLAPDLTARLTGELTGIEHEIAALERAGEFDEQEFVVDGWA